MQSNEHGRGLETVRDLYAIFGAEVQVEVASELVSIKPLTLGQLPAFLSCYQASQFADTSEGDPGFPPSGGEIRALEMLTGRAFGWLNSLADEDLQRLVEAAVMANPTLFEKGEPQGLAAGGGQGLDQRGKALQLAIAQLVEAGHPLSAIRDYSLQQVDVLCRAHACLAAERQISAVVAARGGQATADGFRKLIGELQKRADNLKG